jgi:hypothetical protein
MKSKIDYEKFAKQFAELTEEFIWIHSGSSNSGDLNKVFRDALNTITAYKKSIKQSELNTDESLKRAMIKACNDSAVANTDPWSAMLLAIAERADDWTRYIKEDTDVTEDIREWLSSEARRAL